MIFLVCQLTTPGVNELLWQQEATQATNDMLAKGDTQLANAWKGFYPAFHIAHPGLSVKQVLSAFVATELAGGLGKTIPQIGGTLGQIPGAAAKGAENAIATISNPLDYLKNIAGFFNALTQGSTWLRVAEVAGGLMLIYIALKATMTPGGVPVASRKAGNTFKDTGMKIAKLAVIK